MDTKQRWGLKVALCSKIQAILPKTQWANNSEKLLLRLKRPVNRTESPQEFGEDKLVREITADAATLEHRRVLNTGNSNSASYRFAGCHETWTDFVRNDSSLVKLTPNPAFSRRAGKAANRGFHPTQHSGLGAVKQKAGR